MAQLAQRLALAPELALCVRRIEAAAQHLQRDDLAHAGDIALRAEHRRRTTLAKDADELERSDARARRQRPRQFGVADRRCNRSGTARQGFARIGVGAEQPLDLRALPGVCAVRIEKCGALVGQQVDHGIE
jgi:hypothetical protein